MDGEEHSLRNDVTTTHKHDRHWKQGRRAHLPQHDINLGPNSPKILAHPCSPAHRSGRVSLCQHRLENSLPSRTLEPTQQTGGTKSSTWAGALESKCFIPLCSSTVSEGSISSTMASSVLVLPAVTLHHIFHSDHSHTQKFLPFLPMEFHLFSLLPFPLFLHVCVLLRTARLPPLLFLPSGIQGP